MGANGEYIDVRGSTNVNAPTLQRLIDRIRARHPEAGRIILFPDNARYNHARWRFVKDRVMKDILLKSLSLLRGI